MLFHTSVFVNCFVVEATKLNNSCTVEPPTVVSLDGECTVPLRYAFNTLHLTRLSIYGSLVVGILLG